MVTMTGGCSAFEKRSRPQRCCPGIESVCHTPVVTISLWRSQVTAAIVTCGGLCPGLNDVVQNIVYTLNDYGVPEDQACCL